jgi:hypothetical protein
MADDPTFRVMKAARWKYEAANDGFRKGENWVSRSQAQTAIAAAVRGNEYNPSWAVDAETGEIKTFPGASEAVH